MKTDLLAFVVWLALIVAGSLLSLIPEATTFQSMFWFGFPFVVPTVFIVANGVGVRDLLSRLRIAAPWIVAAVILSALFGLALVGTFGLIVGSLFGAYIGIALFWFWATYPPTKKLQ